jgi:carboxymethylenebutenolidase
VPGGDRSRRAYSPVVTTVDIAVPDGTVPADLHLPAGARGPGIVLFQEIFGVTPYVTARAEDLAALGHVVLVPHVYWRQGDPVIGEGDDALPRAMEAVGRVVWDEAVADGVAAVAALRERPEVDGPVGALGFCFGGGLAFNLAAIDQPDVLISYYGSDIPRLLDLAPRVTAPTLHHFGLADAYLTPDVVERVQAAVSRPGVQVETHPGAGHAFDNPAPMFHHAEASAAAWATTLDFLHRELPVDAAVQS